MKTEPLLFKEDFDQTIAKYHLPTQNKAIFYYTLSEEIQNNPQDEDLILLLIFAICDTGFLINHFDINMSEFELHKKYKVFRKRLLKIKTLINEQANLKERWRQILSRHTMPTIKPLSMENRNNCEKESRMLYQLYCKFFEVSEKNAPELLNNLQNFVHLSYSYSAYHEIAPFFFYQIMVKHTKRLATKENLQFSPKSLWQYKSYKIYDNNHKNYYTYQKYAVLFTELCNYYKSDNSVHLLLCRYGFCQTSNLIDWLDVHEPDLVKECRLPLIRFIQKLDLSYVEYNAPKEFEANTLFHITDDKGLVFIFENKDLHMEIIHTIHMYLVQNMSAFVKQMQDLYANPHQLRKIVQEIYEKSNLHSLFPKKLPLKYQLAEVYDCMLNSLNIFVKVNVESIFEPDTVFL